MKCKAKNCSNQGETICKSCNEMWLCMDHAVGHFSDHKKAIENLSLLERIKREIEKEKLCIVQHYEHLIAQLKHEMNSKIKELSNLNKNIDQIERIHRISIESSSLPMILEEIRKTCCFKEEKNDSKAFETISNSSKMLSSESQEKIEEEKNEIIRTPESFQPLQYKKTSSKSNSDTEKTYDPVGNPVDRQHAISLVNEKIVKVKYPANIINATLSPNQRYLLFCNRKTDCIQKQVNFN